MGLSISELIAFGNAIRNSGSRVVKKGLADGDYDMIASWYNVDSVPDLWVFTGDLVRDRIIHAIDWVNDYKKLSGVKLADMMFVVDGARAVECLGVRDALAMILKDTPVSRQRVQEEFTRKASRFEALFVKKAEGAGGGDGKLRTRAAIAQETGPTTAEMIRRALKATE